MSAPETVSHRLGCHPALLIDEILLQIFLYLPRETLAAAAVTCRAWVSAVDLLWREVRVKDLLNVLDFVETRPGCQEGDAKPVEDWKWDRLRYLAHKVGTIIGKRLSGALDTKAAFKVLRGARVSEKGAALLPNIDRVEWQFWVSVGPIEDQVMNMLLCMGPTLRKLQIITNGAPPAVFFDNLPDTSPRLVELIIIRARFGSERSKSLCKSLARLSALQHVELLILDSTSTEGIMAALEGHLNLHTLHLCGDTNASTSWPCNIQRPFPALRRLKLMFGLEDTGTLDNLAHGSMLTSFELGTRHLVFRNLRATLNALRLHTRLETLGLFGGFSDRDVLRQGFLEAVRLCTRLKDLYISIGQPMELSDGDIEGLAIRLPLLQTLTIRHLYHADPPSSVQIRPTLRAFALLAASCPMIRSITLAVDCTLGVPENTVYPSRHSVASVNVMNSNLDDPQVAAQFFRRLSRGRDLGIIYDIWETNATTWEKVVELMSTLRQASDMDICDL
ncbi:hypothetical protein FRB95_002080 [Tulasnella sp. JGI-2019a]|nr:hypothetical protein FRB95_002080 [Tulasnella sp. JGI-2019a]